MDFRVLGPLQVWDGGTRLALPGSRHQRVLAALLLTPNAVVTIGRLVEATWDGEPPATATKQVQNCVSALRDRLGDTGQRIIVTDGPGYRVVVGEDDLDLLRFTALVARARQAGERGAAREAVTEMRAALRLWRGPALSGLGASALDGRAARLDEQRLDAFEACVDWQLALGQHRQVVDELAEVAAENPLRERVHGQLMLALDRCERQADALLVFERLRTTLAEELGLDPGQEIRDLHERVLRGETRPPARPADADGFARPGELDRAAAELAAAIGRQWTAEVELRSLDRPRPVPLTWASTAREVAAAASSVLGTRPGEVPERLELSGDLTDVVESLRKIPARQLVVLGEPGAGKSVLAILLTLGLLADPRPGEPVPVLLSLTSWNPHTEHLHAWLARRLVEEHPGLGNAGTYGRDAALRLVLEGRVMPVLDGLDETPPGLHTAAIDAIDRAVAGGRPLVLTCRGDEYEAAVREEGAFLLRAAVVEIEPVRAQDAIDFLTARRRTGETRWQPVVQALRREPSSALARALRTPLMVDLAQTAYRDPASDPGELCDTTRFPDRAAVERHLLDAYLPAVYSDRPVPPGSATRARHYDLTDARRWLGFLARHLGGTHDFAWWRLDRAVPPTIAGLLLGLPPAVLFTLTGWFAAGPAIGVVYGVSFGAAGFITHRAMRRPGPLRVEARFAGTAAGFARRFAIGAVIGVSLGFGWSLPVWVACLISAVFGLAVGVHVWLDTPLDANRVSSPGTVLRDDRRAALSLTASFAVSLSLFFTLALLLTPDDPTTEILNGRFDVVLGVAGGLAAGLLGWFLIPRPGGLAYAVAGALIGGQVFEPTRSVAQACLAGGLFGLSVGLSVWFARASGSLGPAVCWLAARGRVPWRFLTFLDDAHRRGVLRQVGAVYQFRHVRLQERLAQPQVSGGEDGTRTKR
ncbi:BTAD domain-containing putative transcriptional regulator [Lentzea sp. NBRC 102530]|uniref:BTAD domain-containing putative transcriptional regulator n=1 Tax=Lentzea sp. NBRC 102530 TaxID=3032201 RepID=UPI0025550D5D|nr:BTAD domain-containing putative transcriptional regulator [Lentzea sp. NBRC 102530]